MSSSVSRDPNSLTHFWSSLREHSSASSQASAEGSSDLIENRCGAAILAGKMMVPSQFLGIDQAQSLDIMQRAIDCYGERLQSLSVPCDTDKNMQAYLLWPEGWDCNDLSRCVVFNNPNMVIVPQFFETGRLDFTPADVLSIKKCPIIFYDYRGTGTNQNVPRDGSLFGMFGPTQNTIVRDGKAVLQYVREKLGFQNVEMWGSSLGGGVATVATDAYLKERNWQKLSQLSVTNHDSFTTTSRVAFPSLGRCADWLGWIVGGNLDAKTPMESLVKKGVKVTVLCHKEDPVIPKGSRMAEIFARTYPSNVTLISSPAYGHANLSDDMMHALKCAEGHRALTRLPQVCGSRNRSL